MSQVIKQNVQTFQTVLEKVPELRYAGDPVLREAATIVALDEGIPIAKNLENVLLKYREITSWGRGLAAPQIGENKSVFITYVDNKTEVFINPRITEKSSETNFYKELCMSVGIVTADVERPAWIVMEWTDESNTVKSERFDGFKARLYQHEEAHLRGRLNIDDAIPGSIEVIAFDPLKEQLRNTR